MGLLEIYTDNEFVACTCFLNLKQGFEIGKDIQSVQNTTV